LPSSFLDPRVGAFGEQVFHDVHSSQPSRVLQQASDLERLLMLVTGPAGLIHDVVDRWAFAADLL
jgi:hypothetical protein